MKEQQKNKSLMWSREEDKVKQEKGEENFQGEDGWKKLQENSYGQGNQLGLSRISMNVLSLKE